MTTLFGNTAVMAIAAPKRKHSLLPVLVVLFVISYGLMTMLIVEQGSVIQSQRNLIQLMSGDTASLSGMKGRTIGNQSIAQTGAQNSTPSTQAQAPVRKQNPSNQDPSIQYPSTQAPSVRTPSTQGTPQQQHGPGRTGRVAKPGPQAPPIPAADLVDHRRSLVTI